MVEVVPDGLRESIKEAENNLKSITEQIKKARAVGVDVKELQNQLETQKKQIDLIKRVYKL